MSKSQWAARNETRLPRVPDSRAGGLPDRRGASVPAMVKWTVQCVILLMLTLATGCVLGAMMLGQIFWPEAENEWDRLQRDNEARR